MRTLPGWLIPFHLKSRGIRSPPESQVCVRIPSEASPGNEVVKRQFEAAWIKTADGGLFGWLKNQISTDRRESLRPDLRSAFEQQLQRKLHATKRYGSADPLQSFDEDFDLLVLRFELPPDLRRRRIRPPLCQINADVQGVQQVAALMAIRTENFVKLLRASGIEGDAREGR